MGSSRRNRGRDLVFTEEARAWEAVRRRRRMLDIASVVLAIIALAFLWLAFSQPARAADTWPCRLEGWEVGTQWGPGPEDVVPDVPICGDELEPGPSDPVLDVQAEPALPAEPAGMTPPPTDT